MLMYKERLTSTERRCTRSSTRRPIRTSRCRYTCIFHTHLAPCTVPLAPFILHLSSCTSHLALKHLRARDARATSATRSQPIHAGALLYAYTQVCNHTGIHDTYARIICAHISARRWGRHHARMHNRAHARLSYTAYDYPGIGMARVGLSGRAPCSCGRAHRSRLHLACGRVLMCACAKACAYTQM